MGLLDKSPASVEVVNKGYKNLDTLAEMDGFGVYGHLYSKDTRCLAAILRNVAVYAGQGVIEISLNGIDGDRHSITLNATNFPNLISGSCVMKVLLLPWTRRKTATVSETQGLQWRCVIFTDKSQVYHNFPSRAATHDGDYVEGDEYLFEESCVWDLPDRTVPVATNSGNDATLIATGCYRYMPALPVDSYEMHPAVNAASSYGNSGFPAVYSYTDGFSGQAKKRPRFFFETRATKNVSPFMWMSGAIQDNQVSVIGTYRSSTTNEARTCVFATTDGGRQWFVQYEFGACGEMLGKGNDENYSVVSTPWNNPSYPLTSWGTNSDSSGVFSIKKRSQYVTTEYEKTLANKFAYGASVGVSSIVSSATGIVVTTSAEHGLANGDIIVFEKSGDTSNAWDWIVSSGHTANSAGNGVVWKVNGVTSTTFVLHYEARNPENNFACRHIHAINKIKDGYIISCGEGYPFGWVLWLFKKSEDDFFTKQACDTFHIYRMTNTRASVLRLLGMQMYHDGTVIVGSDNSDSDVSSVTLPDGTTIQRNSIGIFKGSVADMDDYASYECIYEPDEPAYFFKEIDGVMIFCGQRQTIAVSFDRGESWQSFRLPVDYVAMSDLIGVSDNKEIGIKYALGIYGSNTIVIRCNK